MEPQEESSQIQQDIQAIDVLFETLDTLTKTNAISTNTCHLISFALTEVVEELVDLL